MDIFQVDSDNQIICKDFIEPEVRGEVYDFDISTLKSPEDLIREGDYCVPLVWFYEGVYNEIRDNLILQINNFANLPPFV